jgi:hypothetical protein
MVKANELKSSHLEQIKNYLKEYVGTGNDVFFKHDEADGFSAYRLTNDAFYTMGYGYFESLNGPKLNYSFVNNSDNKVYSIDDFYKHLDYSLACMLLNSIKD